MCVLDQGSRARLTAGRTGSAGGRRWRVRDDHGAGALRVAAAHGRTRLCAYLVEELEMDVNATAVMSGDTLLYSILMSYSSYSTAMQAVLYTYR